MARLQASLLGAAERDTLHEQTLTVLEEVGGAYNTTVAMDILDGTEAVLDHEHLTAKLPRELVERCLETAPRKLLLAARDPAHDVWHEVRPLPDDVDRHLDDVVAAYRSLALKEA